MKIIKPIKENWICVVLVILMVFPFVFVKPDYAMMFTSGVFAMYLVIGARDLIEKLFSLNRSFKVVDNDPANEHQPTNGNHDVMKNVHSKGNALPPGIDDESCVCNDAKA